MIELTAMDSKCLQLSPLDEPSLPVARHEAASPRMEAITWLHLAAEVEHALMLQYLYAAYSVRSDHGDQIVRNRARSIQGYLLQIAREEMGHLMTVQNLLSLIGAPLHLGRSSAPERCGFHPFLFTLEPLSSRSLAKYITAERPHHVADPELRRRFDELAAVAQEANRGYPVKHVGAVYARLLELFRDPEHGLRDDEFRDDAGELRARWSDWGYHERNTDESHPRRVHVHRIEGSNAQALRAQALIGLEDILEQGEGYTYREHGHCDRLLQLYELVRDFEQTAVELTWPVAINPTTVQEDEKHYIENATARAWAQLCNLRYQLLLGYIHHFLHVAGPRYVQEGDGVPDEAAGDHTPRGLLLRWAFDEMRRLAKISVKLMSMPLRTCDDRVCAGPPFELRGTNPLLDDATEDAYAGRLGASHESAHWRAHARLVELSRGLVRDLVEADAAAGTPADPFLDDLLAEDANTADVLAALASGRNIPGSYQPRAFQKAAHILEQAGRGFTMGAHGNFWADITRDEFVQTSFYGMRFLGSHPDAPAAYSSENSLLVEALEQSMPACRPRIDETRLGFLKKWIDAQAPDGTPAGRVGVRHERAPRLDRCVRPDPGGDADE